LLLGQKQHKGKREMSGFGEVSEWMNQLIFTCEVLWALLTYLAKGWLEK